MHWHNLIIYASAFYLVATKTKLYLKGAVYGREDVDRVWNVMAHAQKPDLVFRRNGRVHLNRQARQFSRLLAAELCASAIVILGTPCSEAVWSVAYWLPTPFANFPFTSPPLRHRVPSHCSWTLLHFGALFPFLEKARKGYFSPQIFGECGKMHSTEVDDKNVLLREFIPVLYLCSFIYFKQE